ncbi:MAG: hypothetical protein JWQ20_4329 [Conexibacter sp.]|nr:hypothetical protein [Conexibacter sp.]
MASGGVRAGRAMTTGAGREQSSPPAPGERFDAKTGCAR